MFKKSLKITHGPFQKLAPTLDHLARVARAARGKGKLPPPYPIPRLFELQAMDSNAQGFIAIPREYGDAFCHNRIFLQGIGEFEFEPAPKFRLLRAVCLVVRDREWCVEFEVESGSKALGPESLKTDLHPSEIQREQLHCVFADLILWQKYFIDWKRIPPYRKPLPKWALTVVWRSSYWISPYTLWALTNMADVRKWPKGITSLHDRFPKYLSDHIWVDGVQGKIKMSAPAQSKFSKVEIEYCKEEDTFTATFRR